MIKRLARCAREYKKDSIPSPIFITLEVLMEVAISLLVARTYCIRYCPPYGH